MYKSTATQWREARRKFHEADKEGRFEDALKHAAEMDRLKEVLERK